MKLNQFILYLCCLIQWMTATAQTQPAEPEEYAYYRNGKKVLLKPQSDEVFVTFATKASLTKGKSVATQLSNQLAAVNQADVFAPVNAVRYKLRSRNAASTAVLQTIGKQFKSNPDVITAYPAFTVGKDTVYVGNKVLYVLKPGSSKEPVNAFLKRHKATVVEEIDLGDKKVIVVAISKGGSVFTVANGLFESGLVEYAEPNFTSMGKTHVVPNDPSFGNQWFLHQASDADIDAPEAWNLTTGSSSVVVAVLDGHGFELTHPDLAGKIVNAYDADKKTNSPMPQNQYANHGTACAGLIAAATNNALGVASAGYNIKVLPINIGYNVESDGKFHTNEDIIARAAARVIATPGVVAVSNSYANSSSDVGATREASYYNMRYKSRNGLGAVILASTGNDSKNNPIAYPANYSFVIGVGASTSIDRRAPFSNYGSYTDIVAPGANTTTIDRTGTLGYDPGDYNTHFSGTSAACPIAASVVGLMASANPNTSASNYEMALLKSADKVGGYSYATTSGYPYGYWNNEMGYGRVNAYKAVQAIIESPGINGFMPIGGPVGTQVTITGTKFLEVTSVTFNNISAQFAVNNDNTITATVPSGDVTGLIRVSNGLRSGTSSGILLGTSRGIFTSSTYCFPSYYRFCSSNDYIDYFEFGTLVNNGSGCNGQTGNYKYYPPAGFHTTQVLPGQTYSVYLKSGPSPQGFGIWIDYNEDADFDDSGEFVYRSPTASTNTFAGAITIPTNVYTGMKRMRVRSMYTYSPTADLACPDLQLGETEDYTITVGYCIPTYTYSCGSGDYIQNFSFNTLVHNGSGCIFQPNNYINYSNFSSFTTTVAKGQTYPLKMQSGSFPQGFGVWIDYNNDQDFEEAAEFVYGSSTSGTVVFSANITIPTTVSTGQRRLRVRAKRGEVFTAGHACQGNDYGETEDYMITIADPVVATSQWNKRYGGSGTDNFSRVIRTSDGGYLLGGYSASPISGNKSEASQGGTDFWIVKTDASGNKAWDKRFGGSTDDNLNALIATSDGGYLLGGNSLSGISGDKSQGAQGGQDYWVVKISATGSKLWDKRFGGSANDDLRTLHQLPTGEYLLAGHSLSGAGGDKSQASQGANDFWVVKISATGSKLWDKRFGGSSDDWLEASVLNSDGSLLLGGRSASGLSGDKSQASQGGRDFWVVKINSSGAKLWDKRFGGSGNDEQYALIATSDGNYLLGGKSDSGTSGDKTQGSQGGSDFWVVKINGSGAKLWDKRFGGSSTDELRSMVQDSDGGFLLGGRSDSGLSGDKSQASQGGQDYWTVKINASGSKLWGKRFGGSAAEELRTVLLTSEGGYLLGGRSDSGVSGDKTQSSQGGTDYWLVKLSASGGATLATTLAEAREETEVQEPEDTQVSMQTYPNPFSQQLTIEFTLQKTEQALVKVYDLQGREVKTLFEGEAEAGKPYELTWQVTSEKAGMYVVRLATLSAVTQKKVILIK